MQGFKMRSGYAALASLMMLGLVLGACESDSPTAPQQVLPPPPSPGPSATWTITVTATPSTITLVEGVTTATAAITTTIRRAGTNQPPPDGTTAVVTTSLESRPLTLTNGTGSANVTISVAEAGTVSVQVSFEGSVKQGTISVVEAPIDNPPVPLFIERVQPDRGSPVGGQRVRILGTGFEEPTRVLFGATPVVVKSVEPTVIVVETPFVDLPVGEVLTVAVTVQVNVNEEGAASDTLAGAFTFTRGSGGGGGGGGGGGALVPRLISITPASGPNEGGTQVIIRGEGFENLVQVFFGTGTRIEAEVLDVSSARIVAVTPAATGFNSPNRDSLVDVQVINVASGFEDTLASGFQYGSVDTPPVFISALSPSEGPYTGGDTVTISGSGFDGPVAVSMAGVGQHAISVTGTEIVLRSSRVVLSSCSDVSGAVEVVNQETGVGATGPDWTYRVFNPAVTSLSPSSIATDAAGNPIPAGAQLTISGFNFDPPVSVSFGDVLSLGGTLIAPDTFVVTIPSFTDAFDEEACDDNGDGTEGTRLLPTAVDLTVVNTPSTCETVVRITYVPPADCVGDVSQAPTIFDVTPRSSDEDGVAVTITGANFQDPARVLFGDVAASGTVTVSSGTITTFAPPFNAFEEEACDDNGDGTMGMRFIATTVDVTVINLVPGEEDTFPNSFTYVPSAAISGCRNDIGPAPPPPPPVASFAITGRTPGVPAAPGGTATVTDTSQNVTLLRWDFGDFTPLVNRPPGSVTSHVYTADGTFTITLTVTGTDGTQTSTTQMVTFP